VRDDDREVVRWEDYRTPTEFIEAIEKFHNARSPSKSEVLERAARLAGASLRTVRLQIRRIRSQEPEDEEWILRPWADCLYLVQALWGMKLAGDVAASKDSSVKSAVTDFVTSCGDLEVMRHVAQHLDNFALDANEDLRRQRRPDTKEIVGRRSLEVGGWNENKNEFHWLGGVIRFDESVAAAHALYSTICDVRDDVLGASPPATA
jgi:hypothetical protein